MAKKAAKGWYGDDPPKEFLEASGKDRADRWEQTLTTYTLAECEALANRFLLAPNAYAGNDMARQTDDIRAAIHTVINRRRARGETV